MEDWAWYAIGAVVLAMVVVWIVRLRVNSEQARQLRHARRWQKIEADRRH